MMDNQIINDVPKCELCNRNWEKTVPLGMYRGIWLCGNCILIAQKKDNEVRLKWLQELKNG